MSSDFLNNRYYYIPNNWDLVKKIYSLCYEKPDDEEFNAVIYDQELIEIPQIVLEKCKINELREKCRELILNKSNFVRRGSFSLLDGEIASTVRSCLDIDLYEASNNEFWNGIILGTEEFIRYIENRWKISNESFPNITKRKKRFISGSSIGFQRHNTFARVWWGAELTKDEELLKLFLNSQDAVDRILETEFLLNDFSQLFFIACREFTNENDNIKANEWQYIVRFGKHLINGKNMAHMSFNEIIDTLKELISQVKNFIENQKM